jgi:hypothetical protein
VDAALASPRSSGVPQGSGAHDVSGTPSKYSQPPVDPTSSTVRIIRRDGSQNVPPVQIISLDVIAAFVHISSSDLD